MRKQELHIKFQYGNLEETIGETWVGSQDIYLRLRAGRPGFDSRQEQWKDLCLFAAVSGAHPTFYLVSTSGTFSGGKAAGAWSWPLTSI